MNEFERWVRHERRRRIVKAILAWIILSIGVVVAIVYGIRVYSVLFS